LTARYRLLALDLDGTTLLPTGEVSQATKHWIERAIQAGVLVMCATGRGRPHAEAIWSELFPGAPAVLANGAEVWLDPDTPLERNFMNPDHVVKLYELVQEMGISYWAYSTNGVIYDEDLFAHEPGDGWFKFGVFHRDTAIIDRVWKTVAEWEGITVTSSHPSNVEISAQGVSKKSGVERVCDALKIPITEVMAVGDSHNDIELITAAGLGVAVENASEEVKRAADIITKSNAEDGVAYAIQKYLL
jgi:hydroxymethylpyrimidine pyrophosphatase-like HAD family hydrolase